MPDDLWCSSPITPPCTVTILFIPRLSPHCLPSTAELTAASPTTDVRQNANANTHRTSPFPLSPPLFLSFPFSFISRSLLLDGLGQHSRGHAAVVRFFYLVLISLFYTNNFYSIRPESSCASCVTNAFIPSLLSLVSRSPPLVYFTNPNNVCRYLACIYAGGSSRLHPGYPSALCASGNAKIWVFSVPTATCTGVSLIRVLPLA
jgi:hypothetical protein